MPFNTPQGRSEALRRRRAKEERLYAGLVSLMNDTKWREVFTLIVTRGVWFQIQLVGWTDSTLSILLREYHPTVFQKSPQGFVDGVLGSGFFLRELRRVRCPTIIPGHLVQSARDHPQELGELVEALKALGRIPLEVTDDYVEVRGYDEITRNRGT